MASKDSGGLPSTRASPCLILAAAGLSVCRLHVMKETEGLPIRGQVPLRDSVCADIFPSNMLLVLNMLYGDFYHRVVLQYGT